MSGLCISDKFLHGDYMSLADIREWIFVQKCKWYFMRNGIMNHTNPGFPKVDLYEFVKSVKYILELHHKDHVFKKDILPYLVGGGKP